MNECKWIDCNNEARSKSPFCSQACKKRYRRASGTDQACEVVQIASGTASGTASLQHYEDNPDMYASRTAANTLNWSDPMTMPELKQHGLTANRRPIPGDWDYDGCCELIGGQWQAKA
jgi:hypothetical protein